MRRFLPSLSALQAFESAAQHLSFTKAAGDLMLTQSGVSRQIANLEANLGLRLFERVGSRLVLTDDGRSYAGEVRQILNRLEESTIDAVRGRKKDVSLMLGMLGTFGSRWLLPRLGGFVSSHPTIPLEIVELEAGADPHTAGIDLAVLRGVGSWTNARVIELFKEQLTVAAAPQLLERIGPIDRLDFCRFPTLQNASRPTLWLHWLRASGHDRVGVIQGAVRLPSNEMLIRGAVNGLGLAVIPIHYIEEELASGKLVQPFPGAVPSGESYWAVIPQNKSNKPNLGKMCNWLLHAAKGR